MNEVTQAREKQVAERKKIHALQDYMHTLPESMRIPKEILTSHFFAPGVYARMFVVPEGIVAIGEIHKTEHLTIICNGKVSISTEDGPMFLEGPCVFTSRPGVKKAVYALEESTWITIHVTEETDLKKIEEIVVAKDYDEIESSKLLRVEGETA